MPARFNFRQIRTDLKRVSYRNFHIYSGNLFQIIAPLIRKPKSNFINFVESGSRVTVRADLIKKCSIYLNRPRNVIVFRVG